MAQAPRRLAAAIGETLDDGDIIVVAQKIVSKAEGRIVDLRDIVPSDQAITLAKSVEKDPRHVELLLRRPQYASSVSPPYIAKSLAREQKARRSRFIATRASRSAARASQLEMLRRKSSFCEKAKPAPEWAIR